jgi:hypothetical protein
MIPFEEIRAVTSWKVLDDDGVHIASAPAVRYVSGILLSRHFSRLTAL